MVQVCTLSDMWLSKYGLLENFDAKILSVGYVLDFDFWVPPPGMDPGVCRLEMKANPKRYIAPDKAAYCVFTQFRGPENAIKLISVRTKTQ